MLLRKQSQLIIYHLAENWISGSVLRTGLQGGHVLVTIVHCNICHCLQ